MTEEFSSVLVSNDTESLKEALQNLLIMFESQNRNYLELKKEIKHMKTKRSFSIEQADSITISPDVKDTKSDIIVEDAYNLLASIRCSRNMHKDLIENFS